jgi:hypothetical protein
MSNKKNQMSWPVDVCKEFDARTERYNELKKNPFLQKGAKAYYGNGIEGCIAFINDWCITYDPRNATNPALPTTLPFKTFQRQDDLVKFILSCLDDQENGLVEKSRDMGATWICVCVSVWLWLFVPGACVGWGSRKEELVDRIGDPKSIFDKIRTLIDHLPFWMTPDGFKKKDHCLYMKVINPENGATIVGEGGDNIGRGGRTSIYFKDESAWYARPEMIEAALGDNTNVQIDISSVHGTGNVFARTRKAGEVWAPGKKPTKGKVRVLIMDWRDHPGKDQEWYDKRKQQAEDKGLSHIFAQEVDRDYSASVEGVLIPAKWVKAAIDAHKVLGFKPEGLHGAALDVADEGKDKHAYSARTGVVLHHIESWKKGDGGVAARKSISLCRKFNITKFSYDSVGVGASVKSEMNRLKSKKLVPKNLEILPWNGQFKVLFPTRRIIQGDTESPTNKDFYANLKAQAGWNLRNRFEKTYKCVVKGEIHAIDELISLSSNMENLHELVEELSQPTIGYDGAGKVLINKQPEGTSSPNLYDSVAMNYWPVEKRKVLI